MADNMKLVALRIEEDRKQRALDMYKKNKISLGEAAKFAGMYISDFMDLMTEKGIESNVTLEMIQKSKSLRDFD